MSPAMPEDELADVAEASRSLTIHDRENEGKGINFAAERLAQEARQPLVFSGSRGTKDVTAEFAAAAKQLQPGQLVKDDYFTLFEAVGALEIMDPKMDSGYIPPGDSVEPRFDVCLGLPAEEVIWIMDELLRLTIVWHDGYPLSQTIYTSLHVDRLLSPDNKAPYTFSFGDTTDKYDKTEERLVHVVLRAFCVALVKSCALVLHTIQSQNFYEEEDFVTHLFGRELLPGVGAEEALRLVDEAVSFVEAVELDKDVRSALSERLQFVRLYVSQLMNDIDDWTDMTAMGEIADTHALVRARPEAFSDKVQRQLATSTPPRPMVPITWKEAHQRWLKLSADITEAGDLTDYDMCQSPHGLQRAIWVFVYRNPTPNTFARAYLQNKLFAGEQVTEGITFFDLMLTDMRDLVLAGHELANPQSFVVEMPADPRHKCSRIMESFMDKAFDEYMNLYRMVCQNRCRIRRTFTQSVGILDVLEKDAQRSDAELDGVIGGILLPTEDDSALIALSPLTSWTKYHKLLVMAWTIQLGFETDIYLPHEAGMMYWYLMVFAQRRRKLLEHIDRFTSARVKNLASSGDVRPQAEAVVSLDWLAVLRKEVDLTISLSSALWQLNTALAMTKAIEAPKRDYAQEQLLYDVRMKSYLGIAHDPVPSLDEYRDAEQSIRSIDEACVNVDSAVKDAKACLAELKKTTSKQGKYFGTENEWKREMKQLETSCVAVGVQTFQLRRTAYKHGQQSLKGILEVRIPPPGSRYHDWWPVPQVKEKKATV
ncbi:N-alpha-acetyltransferase, non-catalitic subunit [Elasticomyces elasticus]|uniref:N-alpha-acetyltransferase, non-catalitic subunit n=1 Tax=Elasticomyces elasticus TaxID=574655 RepID=A0AAN8A3W5_9PEZI|nr:N-alpha-acetyltransferase, non-catalitic subunit [Elasticomyces elasticus]